VALALALPGPALLPLVLVVPGLLRRAARGTSGWRAFRIGWLAGTAQWLVAVPWVTIVMHRYGHLPEIVAVLAWLLMSTILGLTWAVAVWGTTRAPGSWHPWLLPLALTAMEVWQRFPPWGFPWNPVAAAATAWPVLLRPLPNITTAGLSLLLLLLGGGLDALLERRMRRVGGAVTIVAVAVFTLTSALAPAAHESGEGVTVAALQPDVPLEFRWKEENLRAIEENVWGLSRTAAARGAAWIVWPESAIPLELEHDPAYRQQVDDFVRTHQVWLTFGSIGFSADGSEYFNSMYTASPQGLLAQRYDKVHLVPFGEYIPVVGTLPILRPLVREVGAFTPGTSTKPVPGPVGPSGYAVCYEVAFPSLAAAEVRQGARVLVTITNDGWYGDSAAPRQHLALAILRAAEERRFVVRAANTGISAIVDPWGRVVQRLGVGKRGMLLATVEGVTTVTLAARVGAWLRGGVVVLALGVILLGGRRRARRGIDPPAEP
jgi:apolipoprotein N-acyltransferase